MTKNLLLCIVFTLFSTSLYSQSFKLSGVVKNISRQGVPQASITLRSSSDSVLVRGTLSDEEGHFVLENLRNGEYFLTISHLNFESYSMDIQLDGRDITTGDILLGNINGITLNQVEIKRQKPLLERSVDKVIVNIEDSPYEKGENAFRLMNVIPEVNVIGTEILFRGSENVNIYIDGRKIWLSSDQLAAYLDNIPSESIKSYELKAVPGAENDAQHGGVIVNIILKSEYKFGLSGNIRGGYWYNGYDNANGSTMINYRVNKITFQGSFNYRNSPSFYEDDTEQEFKSLGIYSTQREKYLEKFNTYGVNAGFDYKLSETQTLGANYNIFMNPRDFDNSTITLTKFMVSKDFHQVDSSVLSYKRDHFRYISQMANAFYRSKLDSLGSKLDIGYSFVNYSLDNPITIETNFFNKVDDISNRSDSLFTYNNGSSDVHVFNIDMEKYFTDSLTLTVGGKYTTSKTDYRMDYRNGLNESAPLDKSRSDGFLYNEKVLAFYSTISRTINFWQIKLGLRGEQTNYKGVSKISRQEIHRNRWDFFPSLFINRKINENNSLTLSYARYIDRPGFRQLNPFTFYTSMNNIEEGNPNLLPYYSNNVQIEYLLFNKYSMTAGYQKTSDGIATKVRNEGEVIVSRLENIYDNYNFFLSTYIPIKVTNAWALNINAIVRNTVVDVNSSPSIHGSKFSQNLRASNRFTLPKDYVIEVSGMYSRNRFYDFYDAHDIAKVDFSVTKRFFKDRLTSRIEVSDPLHLYKPGQTYITDGLRRDVTRNRIDFSRYIGVWLTYNFSKGRKQAEREYIEAGGEEVRERL